ncbi:uncharacterized protein LOC141855732 isoform X2 [Brevipalpus obovatus]|uniref:uncharacterized protein LOC141855732 isoform X2 n=1 Tax=Brevipalpus obovatus TaxID=246614 RepID=UPI003D9F9FB5
MSSTCLNLPKKANYLWSSSLMIIILAFLLAMVSNSRCAIFPTYNQDEMFDIDETHEASAQQQSNLINEAKRISEFLGGPGKRYSEFLGGPGKRYSEFLGGPGKRYSEFLGGPGKRYSEFLGGPGKRQRPLGRSVRTNLPLRRHGLVRLDQQSASSQAIGTPSGSEFLGGPGKR